MHSSGMRSARLLTVSLGGGSIYLGEGVCLPRGSAYREGVCIQVGLTPLWTE